MKVSTMIISLCIVALFTSVFSSFYAGVADSYQVTLDSESEATLNAYNQLASIQNTTEEIETELFSSQDGDNTDLLGTFLGAGFNVLKIAKQSMVAFGAIAEAAEEALGLPSYFFSVLLTIATLIILFAIISALIGKDI